MLIFYYFAVRCYIRIIFVFVQPIVIIKSIEQFVFHIAAYPNPNWRLQNHKQQFGTYPFNLVTTVSMPVYDRRENAVSAIHSSMSFDFCLAFRLSCKKKQIMNPFRSATVSVSGNRPSDLNCGR